MKTNIAALTSVIRGNNHNEIQLFPAGEFRANDGRPADCARWVMTREIAENLIQQVTARKTPLVIDYEHQTLRAIKNGQPAPAAGWLHTLEWREGEGLYAINVDWTDKAREAIAANEYKFISPVFLYDQQGHVTALLHSALTNTPALDGMDAVMLAAASQLAALNTPQPEDHSVDDELIKELLNNLRWMLNLPATATTADIIAELQKAIDLISNGQGTATAASQGLLDLLQAQKTQIADLSSKAYDPAKYVPIAGYQELQAQLNSERQQAQVSQVDSLVQAALSDGRLTPALEDWAKELGRTNFAALTTHLEKAQPIAALSSLQSGGQTPAAVQSTQTQTAELDADALAICNQFGLSPDDIKKQLGER
ncbi:phage protease [Xenorhabdus miraniensis]|uniref:Mu-like prophage I family protein n=1 Tax=Xenorhabdus miraniensis TaxID=351674 RepID=A0A2D0JLC0_9GAMM|nr:phage protease [Xenorhabdus miraniensis]PHM47095.1 mu-like prophage I family protein [Xenorhabdus miraniensis]